MVSRDSDVSCDKVGSDIDLWCKTVIDTGFSAVRHATTQVGSVLAANVCKVVESLDIQSAIKAVYNYPDKKQYCGLDSYRFARIGDPGQYVNKQETSATETAYSSDACEVISSPAVAMSSATLESPARLQPATLGQPVVLTACRRAET